jgi:hypothetical protein
MSCEFTYSPGGRAGIGVIQPQSGLDYPLVQPSEDIRFLLADFYLAFDDRGEYAPDTPPAKAPFQIAYLCNIGCAANEPPADMPPPRNNTDADIIVTDANGRVILNTALGVINYTARDWNTDYRIYEWRTADAVCRLVAHTTWATTDGDARHYDKYLVPQNAELDPRAVYKMPRRVRSLSVRQKNGTLTLGPYTGKFVFNQGYNTTLVPAPTTTTRFVVDTAIDFAAVAGTGRGFYPVCGDVIDEDTKELIPQPIITINGINGTPDGNFLLVGRDCLYVRLPTQEDELCVNQFDPVTGQAALICTSGPVPIPAVDLQVGADCLPCCECPDYVKTALYMNKVCELYKKISDYTTAAKETHEENIKRWAERLSCAIANPLKLALVPQNCPFLDIVVMICYPCSDCLAESELTLVLATNPALDADSVVSVVCGYTEIAGAGKKNTRPIQLLPGPTPGTLRVSIGMPVINGGGSAYVKFRLKFEDRIPYTVTGTLTGKLVTGENILTGCNGTQRDLRQAATTVVTQTINCDDNGNTTKPC